MSEQILLPRVKDPSPLLSSSSSSSSSSPNVLSNLQHHNNKILKDEIKYNYHKNETTQMVENQKIHCPVESVSIKNSTKRAKIELDNVQTMVKRIKEDFNSYYIVNEKLRNGIIQKRTKLLNYTKKTGDCCDRLGKLGAQISLHEHRLQELEGDEENLDNFVQQSISERVNQYFLDLQSAFVFITKLQKEVRSLLQTLSSLEESAQLQREEYNILGTNFQMVLENKRHVHEAKNKIIHETDDLVQQLEKIKIEVNDLEKSCEKYHHELDVKTATLLDLRNQCDELEKISSDLILSSTTQLKVYDEKVSQHNCHITQLKSEIIADEIKLSQESTHLKEILKELTQKDIELESLNIHLESERCIKRNIENTVISVQDIFTRSTKSQTELETRLIECQQQAIDTENELKNLRLVTRNAEEELSHEMEKAKNSTQLFYNLKNEKLNFEWKLKQTESMFNLIILEKENKVTELETAISNLGIQANEDKTQIENLEIELEKCQNNLKVIQHECDLEVAVKEKLLETEVSLNDKKILLKSKIEEFSTENKNQNYTEKYEEMKQQVLKLLEEDLTLQTRIEHLNQLISIERVNQSKKPNIQLSNEQLANIEKQVDDQYTKWEEKELETHQTTIVELESQLQKLQGGSSVLFPELYLSRSHELSKLRGILINLKQGRGEKDLAKLVSHIHSKINKTAANSWNNVDAVQDVGPSQSSLGILLSPMIQQRRSQETIFIEDRVNLTREKDIHTKPPTKALKKQKSTGTKSRSDESNMVSQRKEINESRIEISPTKSSNDQKKSQFSGKLSLPTQPKPSLQKKKITLHNHSDWLFDDKDMSIN